MSCGHDFQIRDFMILREIKNYYEEQVELVKEKGLELQLDELFFEIMDKMSQSRLLSEKGEIFKRNFFKAFLEVEND